MCTTVPHWCAPYFAPGDPTVPICTLHLQTISCVDLRGMRRGQHASVSGRRALTARYLSRYARRALVHTSHASDWCQLLARWHMCLGERNGVRSARQVQGAVRRRGAYSGSRSVSNGARARGASERAVAARACDSRTPKVQHCQNCQPSRRHWHLNEKDR